MNNDDASLNGDGSYVHVHIFTMYTLGSMKYCLF